tara:strand:+ start:5262 stop:6560 length:1299 start_codon:yes stop_codon:yes gene_type:complete
MGSSRRSRSSAPQQTSSTVTQQTLPDYAQPYYQKMMSSAEALMGEGYQPYQGQRIAGFEPEQMGAFQGITAIAGRDQPGMRQGQQTAMEMARGMGGFPMVTNRYMPGQIGQLYQAQNAPSGYQAGDVGPLYQAGQFGEDPIRGRMGAYQSPYQEAVLDRLQRRAIERFDEGQTQRDMQAAQQGAFGGSRAALQDFTARRDLEERLTDMEAQQLQRGFGESARLAGMDVSQAQRAREAQEAARQRQGMMGLSGFEAQERARQAEGQMGLTAYQAEERARQAEGQMGLSGFEAQERARQAAGQMGITADTANQRAFEAQQARRLQAAGLLPKMSSTEQMLDLQRMAALRGVGGEFQAQRQQMMDQGYQDFINQRDYPRQNLAFFQQLLSGLPVTPSSEVMRFEPRPNPYAQMMNMGLGGMQMMGGMRGMGGLGA